MRWFFTLLLFFLIGLPAVHAQTGTDAAIAMVGKWSAAGAMPDGTEADLEVSLTQSMKFSGSAKMQGKLFWSFSGSWEVQGNQITWRYEKSSRSLSEASKIDSDEIISVDAEKMVLLSKLTGQRRVFLRAR